MRSSPIAGRPPDSPGIADLAQNFLRKLPVEEYPYFVEHAEQHLTKSVGGGKSEFEFGLDLILDGLERIRTAPSGRSVPIRPADRPTPRSGRPRQRGR